MNPRAKYAGIYTIRCLANGRVYVGSSASIGNRLSMHRWQLQRGKHHSSPLQRSWQKHGESAFAFEIIEAVLDPRQLVSREQFWIDRLSATVRRGGFNVCPAAGSPLGRRHTKESRERMSAAKKGKSQVVSPEGRAAQEAARKRRRGLPGLPASPETRAKMSLAHKGQPSSRKGLSVGPMPEKTKRAISEALKNSDAYRRSALAKIGKKLAMTDRGRAAKADAAKKRIWSAEARAAIAASNARRAGRALSLSAEGRAAKAVANKKRWAARIAS